MKRLRMTVESDRASIPGDCFRTCVAMLLECDDPREVPHFLKSTDTDGQRMAARANRWLSGMGLRLMCFPVNIGRKSLSQFVSTVSELNDNHPYMLWAYQSPAHVRANELHAVIVVGPNVWCDPAYPERKHIDPDEYLPDKDGDVWIATLVHRTRRPPK